MRRYSTCGDCGGLVQVTEPNQGVHPLCDETAWFFRGPRPPIAYDEPSDLYAAARFYASVWAWPVFPLKPGTKEPATRHGFHDASTDLERIEQYWRKHPDANIGCPTGIRFDVIDIDVPDPPRRPEHGADSFDEWMKSGNKNPPDVHGVVCTASGGTHMYITPRGKPSRAGFRPSLDYRGQGGYVVLPPSVNGAGRWRWQLEPSPCLTGVGDTYGR